MDEPKSNNQEVSLPMIEILNINDQCNPQQQAATASHTPTNGASSNIFDLSPAVTTLMMELKFGSLNDVEIFLNEPASVLEKRFVKASLCSSHKEKGLWSALQSSMLGEAIDEKTLNRTFSFKQNLNTIVKLLDLTGVERFRRLTAKDYYYDILESALRSSYEDRKKLRLSVNVWIWRLDKFFKLLEPPWTSMEEGVLEQITLVHSEENFQLLFNDYERLEMEYGKDMWDKTDRDIYYYLYGVMKRKFDTAPLPDLRNLRSVYDLRALSRTENRSRL